MNWRIRILCTATINVHTTSTSSHIACLSISGGKCASIETGTTMTVEMLAKWSECCRRCAPSPFRSLAHYAQQFWIVKCETFRVWIENLNSLWVKDKRVRATTTTTRQSSEKCTRRLAFCGWHMVVLWLVDYGHTCRNDESVYSACYKYIYIHIWQDHIQSCVNACNLERNRLLLMVKYEAVLRCCCNSAHISSSTLSNKPYATTRQYTAHTSHCCYALQKFTRVIRNDRRTMGSDGPECIRVILCSNSFCYAVNARTAYATSTQSNSHTHTYNWRAA